MTKVYILSKDNQFIGTFNSETEWQDEVRSIVEITVGKQDGFVHASLLGSYRVQEMGVYSPPVLPTVSPTLQKRIIVRVASETSRNLYYTVEILDGTASSCTCPDFTHRQTKKFCKHMTSVWCNPGDYGLSFDAVTSVRGAV